MTATLAELNLLLDEVRRYIAMLEVRVNHQQQEYKEFTEWNTSALEGMQARFLAIEQRLQELEQRW